MTAPKIKPGLALYPYQRRWFADRSRFKIGMFARQTGKTFTTTLEIVDDIHAGVALALMAVIAGSFLWTGAGHWVGALAAIFFFYGREMRDHQRERQSAGKGHRNNFNRGDAAPWTWKQDSFMDLALPTAACLTAALAVEIAWALP